MLAGSAIQLSGAAFPSARLRQGVARFNRLRFLPTLSKLTPLHRRSIMKSHRLLTFTCISCAASAALSQPLLPSYITSPLSGLQNILQRPFIPWPGASSSDETSEPVMPSTDELIISDVIARERSINVFAGFTRDVDPIANRLDDQSKNSTILAPLNSAIQKMDHKPWEDSQEYAAFGSQAYGMGDGEERAHKNLGRFVEAHVVPTSPWKEGEKVETLAGTKVWWETKDGDRIVSVVSPKLEYSGVLTRKQIQPGHIKVSTIASKVANGQIWIIEGVLNAS